VSKELLEYAIESYLNTIIDLSEHRLPLDSPTLHYLSQRIYSAFSYELKGQQVSLQPDENRNIILTLIN
jgi:hypothetical protein